MKKALFFLLMILALGAVLFFNRSQVSAAVIHFINSVRVDSGLAALWSFNGPDIDWPTGVVYDRSGNAKNGQQINLATSTSPVPGISGQALKFDGVSGYVAAGSVSSAVQSVTFWVKATSTSIMDLNGTANIALDGGVINAGGIVSPTISVNGVGSTTVDANWSFVAITTGTAINASAVDLGRIGANYFNGSLDEVRFYNRVLGPDEIQYLYQLNAKERGNKIMVPNNTGLVGYWTFDDCDACSYARDMSGKGNDGIMYTTCATTAGNLHDGGKVNRGAFFDGSNDCINIADSASLRPTSLTIAFWMRPGTPGANDRPISKGINSARDYNIGKQTGLAFFYYASGSSLHLWETTASWATVFTPYDRWYHVAVTYTSASGSGIVMYVNGVSQAGSWTSGNGNSALNFSAQPLKLGSSVYSDVPTEFYKGILDEVRIYNRILSAKEIQNLYYNEGRRFFVNSSQNNKLASGLAALWSFNGPDVNWTTGVIFDRSGNAKNGQQINLATSTSPVPGISGQALKLNGSSSSYVAAGNVSSAVQSVSFWMKTATGTTEQIIDLNGTATINATNGTVNANNFTSPTIYVDGATASTITGNNWHHVVVTTGTALNASAVDIGRISAAYYSGTLDEVRMYNRELSSAEVFDLYQSGRR